MAGPGSFDPGAALSGPQAGQGNAFAGIYTDLQPVKDPGSANAAEFDQANHPEELYTHGGPTKLTDPAAYEKFVFSQIANDPAKIKQLQQQLKNAGYSVSVTGLLDAQTDTAYTGLLQDVSVANQSGTVITPEQYLKQKIDAGGANAGRGPLSETSTSYTSPEDARAAALQAFETELGKRPTQKQINAFDQALHAYEAANPTVTTQNTQGGNTTLTSNGGAGTVDNFAQQYVESNFGGQVGQHDALHYFDLAANALTSAPGATHVV